MTWTAPDVDRSDPPLVTGERAALEAWLDYQRETLLLKCSGLTAAQLRERAVPPSGLTLLGLVRHMTEVERWWFRVHGANQDMTFRYTEENLDADFEDLDEPDAEVVRRPTGRRPAWPGPRCAAWTWSTWCPATATTPSASGTSAGSTCT